MQARNRIDDIEALRAIAVVLVVIEHMNLNLFTWGSPILTRLYTYLGGWTGVDLFFAISGFVIARDLVPKLHAARDRSDFFSRVIEFWIRRFWRLTPSAWFWLAFIMLSTVFLNDSGVWGTIRENYQTVISAALHVANLHIAMIFGDEFPGAAFVYWSLSLEEQFYLLLPFIVLLSGRWMPQVLAVAIVVQLLMVRDTLHPVLMRTDALFLGVLLALWSAKESYQQFEPRFLNNRLAALLVLGLLLLGLATIGSDHLKIIHLRFGLIALLSAVLVFIASFDQDYIVRSTWLKPIFQWFGSRSYALYLTHIPTYFLTREIWFRVLPTGTKLGPDHTIPFLCTAVVLMGIFSELNYRLIETPLRRKGVKIAKDYRQRTE